MAVTDLVHKQATIGYDPKKFRSQDMDRLLADLLMGETTISIPSGNGFFTVPLPREFLIELLTRLRIGMEIVLSPVEQKGDNRATTS